ncbi:MAG: UTP--glucose-1-phosphate uridylyltransferase [Akkermansia sp.]|nr:UTP--glucose-1-phosphate uridylyltransferase [Akkermansia sp.]
MSSFEQIESKMKSVGLSEAAINAFRHSVHVLESKQSMLIPESDIVPAEGVADWDALVAATPEADAALLAQSVLIKLNGGLGTSMGLQKAKSLLEIKPGVTFLDLIVRQVKSLRAAAGYPVNLLLMNSFSTSEDTMAHLSRYAEDGFADADKVEMIQNRVPKLVTDTLAPVSFPANPELEWCPPGQWLVVAYR